MLTLNTVYKLLHEKDSLRFTLVVNVEINAIKVATREQTCAFESNHSHGTPCYHLTLTLLPNKQKTEG